MKYKSLQKKEEMKFNSLFLIIKAKIPDTAWHRREETETECYNCVLIQHLVVQILFPFPRRARTRKTSLKQKKTMFVVHKSF